jgi:hypothetical protein
MALDGYSVRPITKFVGQTVGVKAQHTIEIEGVDKPAMVADALAMLLAG